MLVDDDAEDDAVEPGDDAAVEFRRAGVDGDRVALRGIADLLHALVEQHLQDGAAVIGRAADQEIVGGIAPVFLQPFDVGLEAAGGGDQRRRADFVAPSTGCFSLAERNMPSSICEIDDLGIVDESRRRAFRR